MQVHLSLPLSLYIYMCTYVDPNELSLQEDASSGSRMFLPSRLFNITQVFAGRVVSDLF